ncbi:hypothetical protein ACF3NA_00230 [Alkanindiges sp. WGS2144]|uniref:hypothetical protein n=1 Tax=Alkanindiges sp. WGS2144 TaxID=3366808 RepID=UPI0037502140
MPKRLSKKNRLLLQLLIALVLTWLSLLVPAEVQVTRPGTLDCEQGCEIIAAGFPKPFIVDGVISPVGSVSMNPLSLFLAPLDEFIWCSFIISYVFWLALTLIAFRLYRIQHP